MRLIARDYSDQLNRGDGYHLLTPTIMIVWVLEPLFPSLQHLHSVFQLCDIHTHLSFGPWLTIHLLQLSALSTPHATGYDVRVQRWARFFVARDDAELDQLASEDPIMALAKQTLDQLSQDPALHRLARERSEARKLYEMDLAATRAKGEADGEARGRAEGEAKILLKLLGLRFGPLSDAARARVQGATPDQLEGWAEQVLTAESLDEILAPP